MKLGSRVEVKQSAITPEYRGKTGTVTMDTLNDGLVEVEFDDEAISHFLSPDELRLID